MARTKKPQTRNLFLKEGDMKGNKIQKPFRNHQTPAPNLQTVPGLRDESPQSIVAFQMPKFERFLGQTGVQTKIMKYLQEGQTPGPVGPSGGPQPVGSPTAPQNGGDVAWDRRQKPKPRPGKRRPVSQLGPDFGDMV